MNRIALLLGSLSLLIALVGCGNGSSGGGSGGGAGGGSGGGAPLFAKTFGGPGVDVLGDAEALPDGGYIAVGSIGGRRTLPTGTGDPLGPAPLEESDLLVTRLDAFGDPVWSRSLAHGVPSSLSTPTTLRRAHTVSAHFTGGHFVAGTVRDQPGSNPNEYSTDMSLRQLDANGATLWTANVDIPAPAGFTFSGLPLSGKDYPIQIAPIEGGGAYVIGWTDALLTPGGGTPFSTVYLWLTKVDAAGQALWTRNLTETFDTVQHIDSRHVHVVADTEGSAFAIRSSHSLGLLSITTNERTEVTKFAGNGTELWSTDVSNFYVRSAELAYGDNAGFGDGVVFAGDRNGDDSNPEGSRGVVIDAAGGVIFNESLDMFRVDVGIGQMQTPLAGEPGFQFIGAASASPGSLEIHSFDDLGVPLPQYLTQVPGMDRARDVELDYGAGGSTLHLLAQGPAPNPLDPNGRAFRFSKRTSALGSAPFEEEVALGYPLSLSDESFGFRQEAGLSPRGPESWLWFDAELYNATNSRLVAYDSSGAERWVETFDAADRLRTETGLDVEVVADQASPGNWRIAVLARADVDVTGTPDREVSLPWLVILNQDGSIASETALDDAAIGRTTGPGVLESTPSGDLYVGLWANDAPRVLRIGQDGAVRWCSRPIATTTETSLPMHLAAFDAGVVASVGDVIARFDGAGNLAYRRRCPSGEALAIAPVPDTFGDLAILSADSANTGYLRETLYLDLVSSDGERLRRTEWSTQLALAEASGASLLALADGGFVAQVVRRLESNLTASLTQPSDTIALFGIDASGAPAWHSTYGGVRHERASSLSLANDGGLIVAGETESVTDSVDGWLLRLDSCGRISSACAAEFTRTESGFDSVTDTFGPGTTLTNVAGSSLGASPDAVATSALVAPLTDLLITRQCSGASKDSSGSGGGGGGYGGLLDLRVIVEGAGSGTVFVNPPGLLCSGDCLIDDIATPGDSFELEARPAVGSTLGGFTGADSVDGLTGYVTFGNSDRTVRVRFD